MRHGVDKDAARGVARIRVPQQIPRPEISVKSRCLTARFPHEERLRGIPNTFTEPRTDLLDHRRLTQAEVATIHELPHIRHHAVLREERAPARRRIGLAHRRRGHAIDAVGTSPPCRRRTPPACTGGMCDRKRPANPLSGIRRWDAGADALLHQLIGGSGDHPRNAQTARRFCLGKPAQCGRLAEKRLAAARVVLCEWCDHASSMAWMRRTYSSSTPRSQSSWSMVQRLRTSRPAIMESQNSWVSMPTSEGFAGAPSTA